MGHSMTDSALFKNFCGTGRAREIWSDENQLTQWYKFWWALAQAEEEQGIVPKGTADEIKKKGKVENFDLEKLRLEIERTTHPVVPVYAALADICDNDAGKYIHWGATTQDVCDTGSILQMKETADYHEELLEGIIKRLLHLADENRKSVMPGRTHQMHAVPITFGQKLANYADEMSRALIRLRESKERILKGQFAGAAANLASMYCDGYDGQAVCNRMCELLELSTPDAPWHSARDNMAEWSANLNTMCGSISRMCYDLAGLHKQEVAEIEEDMFPGRLGSSTMPQKRNPDNIETIIGMCWYVNALNNVAWNSMHVQHERCSACMMVDLLYIPNINIVASFCLDMFQWLLDTIHIRPEKMKENLNLTRGGIMAEAIMIDMGHKIGRMDAHHIIMDAAMKAYEEQRDLSDVLLEDPNVTAHYTEQELRDIFDPMTYTGRADEIVDVVIKTAGKLLK